MSIRTFEPLLRDATISAIDKVGQKLGSAESKAENAITRLLDRWNSLDRTEKENVAGVIIATAVTAVSAITALRSASKGGAKSVAKRVMKRVTKKA